MMSCSLQLYVGWLLLMAVVAINAAPTADSTHNLEVGSCSHPDQRIYTDNTIVENGGPSTLNGTLEIYIEAPVKITCVRIEDQVKDGTGAIAWIHSGGIGHSWVFIGVQAQYSKGFNFNIHLFGVPDAERLQGLSLSTFKQNTNNAI